MSEPLFACSRCFSRHPFEELSQGQQLCKECRGSYPVVKCTYCRSEFQQESKGNTTTICKKCEANIKHYGQPTACEYCNIIAAFIGNKCQRCTNSEKKFGAALPCDQCKQRCAFDRRDEDSLKKTDGKLLCWLCTQSYRRALAKTKHSQGGRHSHLKLHGSTYRASRKEKYHNKRSHRRDVTKIPVEEPPAKSARPSRAEADHNNSDHMVAMAELKEQIAGLQKQLLLKDQQLFEKGKQMTELKAQQFSTEQDLRRKMKDLAKSHEMQVESLQIRVKDLQRQVASLSKSTKRNNDKNISMDSPLLS